MDFTALACDKVYLRQVNHDIRIETNMAFISDALHYGDQFVLAKVVISSMVRGYMSVRMSVEKQAQEDFRTWRSSGKRLRTLRTGKQSSRK